MGKQLASVFAWVTVFFAMTACAATPTTDPAGDAALAERFAQIAQNNLTTRAVSDITLKESASLLEASCKLDPADPRFPRLRAEACISLHDDANTIAALNDCVKADPSDQVAQCQLIDLYAATDPNVCQSVDKQAGYYKGIMDSAKLAAEVRAHAGVHVARLMLDRGDEAGAKQTLTDALKLNPLDPDGLELSEKFSRNGTVRDQVAALLALLRGNPAQPAVAARLASDLAGEGLTNESATWYTNSISITNRLGMAPDIDTFLQYISEMIVGGQTKGLDATVDSLLDKYPSEPQALYLKLLLARRGDDKDAIGKAVDNARDGFLERLYESYRAATKNDPPATQPSGGLAARTGDISALAKTVKASGDEPAAGFAAALTDLAWVQIYFANQPADAAPLIAALHQLLPDDDVRFARLEGWSLLAAGKDDQAKVKLSAIAERDPLSAMGMIRIAAKDPKQKDDVKSSAQTLLNDNRGGFLAAVLLDGLHDYDVKVQVSDDGNSIKSDLDKFPKQWFTFLDSPQNFYLINVGTMKVAHQFDDPMYAVVSIQNVGPFDISIGTKGAIKPDLWFDVRILGPDAPVNLSGVAYDRITGRLVLKAGQILQQLVRLDQPSLVAKMAGNPQVALQLLFSLVTNPVTGPTGGVAPGPGGQRAPLRKPVARAPSPLNEQREKEIEDDLTNKTGDVRISTLSLVGAFTQLFLSSKDDKLKERGKQMSDSMADLMNDPSQPVASWTKFLQTSLIAPADRANLVKDMSGSDYWPQRLLAAVVSLSRGNDGKAILTELAKDSEPSVKHFAAAALDDLAHPTTQPTTQTSGQTSGQTDAAPVTPAIPAPADGAAPATAPSTGGFKL